MRTSGVIKVVYYTLHTYVEEWAPKPQHYLTSPDLDLVNFNNSIVITCMHVVSAHT